MPINIKTKQVKEIKAKEGLIPPTQQFPSSDGMEMKMKSALKREIKKRAIKKGTQHNTTQQCVVIIMGSCWRGGSPNASFFLVRCAPVFNSFFKAAPNGERERERERGGG